MLRNCINFHVSKELKVIRIEVVVDDKPIYCLLDVLVGVHDELLRAYNRSLRNAAGKRNWSQAATCSCESLCVQCDKTGPSQVQVTIHSGHFLHHWPHGSYCVDLDELCTARPAAAICLSVI